MVYCSFAHWQKHNEISMHEFENVICETTAISSRPNIAGVFANEADMSDIYMFAKPEAIKNTCKILIAAN